MAFACSISRPMSGTPSRTEAGRRISPLWAANFSPVGWSWDVGVLHQNLESHIARCCTHERPRPSCTGCLLSWSLWHICEVRSEQLNKLEALIATPEVPKARPLYGRSAGEGKRQGTVFEVEHVTNHSAVGIQSGFLGLRVEEGFLRQTAVVCSVISLERRLLNFPAMIKLHLIHKVNTDAITDRSSGEEGIHTVAV